MPAVLATEGLVKTFRGRRAVDEVTLSVERGEIYGFLGPNGAGKTTTLRMLLGLVQPEGGRALVRGVDPWYEPRAAHLGVGFLPDTLSLYRTLTGRQTICFFADLKETSRGHGEEMLALVGLADAADKRVGAYSRGMVQRLGLAQALLGDPEILILDEPTGGLDPVAHRQVKDLLRDRNRRGTTILFSSHVLSEVQELAHRVGMLRNGRVVAEDTVDGLRRRLNLKGLLFLTLTHPTPEVAVVAQSIPGVQSASLQGNRLAVECDADLRFEVARRVNESGGGVINMETRDPSLEDVFMLLAGGASA